MGDNNKLTPEDIKTLKKLYVTGVNKNKTHMTNETFANFIKTTDVKMNKFINLVKTTTNLEDNNKQSKF